MGTLVLVTTRDSLTSCFDYAAESEGKSPHRDTGGGKKKKPDQGYNPSVLYPKWGGGNILPLFYFKV